MSATTVAGQEQANRVAAERMTAADPVLVDLRPAIEVVPGMTARTILTSGAPMPWERYTGGQRNAVIGGALFEGLATDPADADAKLRDGRIVLGACHDYGCVGSLAGIYTASMPVFVVENRAHGNVAFCNSFEGASRKRLNYGVYDADVHASLVFLQDVAAPVLAEALRATDGGIPLRPIIRRALNMGDEWFRCGLPAIEAKLFEGHTAEEIEFMGGESIINETAGLGGFAQAAAFPLQDYQGGSPEEMVANTLAMYEITVAEHPVYRIPALSFRGTPTGIDVRRVVDTGVRPIMDVGVAGRDGGQIGAGLMRAPIECFASAAHAFADRYGAEPAPA